MNKYEVIFRVGGCCSCCGIFSDPEFYIEEEGTGKALCLGCARDYDDIPESEYKLYHNVLMQLHKEYCTFLETLALQATVQIAIARDRVKRRKKSKNA